MSQEERKRSTEEAVDSFLDSVNRSGFWQSIDVRVCAVRDGRRWVSLVTRGFLDHRAPRSVPRFSPVHRPDLRAWQVVFPIADLNGVVRGIASETAKLGPRSVTYIGRSSETPTDIRYVLSEMPAPYYSAEYHHWRSHALVDHGASMWGVVRQAGHDPGVLDSMIRGGPNAYDGLSDLVRRLCGRPRGLDVRRNTTAIELIAPLAVRFAREQVASSADHLGPRFAGCFEHLCRGGGASLDDRNHWGAPPSWINQAQRARMGKQGGHSPLAAGHSDSGG